MSSGDCLPLSRGYLHLYDNNIQTSSLNPLVQSKPNNKWRKGSEVIINGPGHITKMAAMAINRKKNIIKLLLQNRKIYDFETWPEASMNTALQSLY